MMNDQDRDLIVALIEGSLSEQDAAAASARIAADSDLAAEYEIQKTIAEALSAVEPVAMTATESSALRGSLIDQLNLDEAPAVVPARGRSSRQPSRWLRPALALGSVAAVFIVGIAVVPNMFSSSDDAGADTVAFEAIEESQTTTEAADMGGSGADGADSTDPAASATPLEVPNLRSQDLDEMLDSVAGESAPEGIEEEAVKFAGTNGMLSVVPDEVAACRELLGNALPDGTLQIIGAEDDDDGLVVIVAFVDDEGADAFARIDLETCVLVDIAE